MAVSQHHNISFSYTDTDVRPYHADLLDLDPKNRKSLFMLMLPFAELFSDFKVRHRPTVDRQNVYRGTICTTLRHTGCYWDLAATMSR